MKYTEDHEWLRLDGDIATVGITKYATVQLGDLVFVQLPEIGSKWKKGDIVAVVESARPERGRGARDEPDRRRHRAGGDGHQPDAAATGPARAAGDTHRVSLSGMDEESNAPRQPAGARSLVGVYDQGEIGENAGRFVDSTEGSDDRFLPLGPAAAVDG